MLGRLPRRELRKVLLAARGTKALVEYIEINVNCAAKRSTLGEIFLGLLWQNESSMLETNRNNLTVLQLIKTIAFSAGDVFRLLFSCDVKRIRSTRSYFVENVLLR